MEDEEEQEEEEEEEEGEEQGEEEEEDGAYSEQQTDRSTSELEERKEDETVTAPSETGESSQKENVDPAPSTVVTSVGRTRQPRKSHQSVEDLMEVDDEIPVLGQPAPVPSSLSSLARPRTRIAAAARPAPELFAIRQPPSTPSYSRHARANGTSSPPATPLVSPATAPSSKAHVANSSLRHIQRATSMSMRRKLTTYTLLTSHLDDDQLALVKELESLINHNHTANTNTVPTTSHPRVILTTAYTPSITHLITSASTATTQLVTHRTNKYFLAQLTPHAAIVTIDWVTESIVARRMLDAAPYAVKGDTRFPHGGDTRRQWYDAVGTGGGMDGVGLLGGWVVGEVGVWGNRVVRDDVRAIVEVGGGQWVGCDGLSDGVVDVDSTRYVVWDDGKKVGDDNRALLTDEMVRAYEERGISAVPCSWLFDCVSSFSILPIPPLP